MKTTALICPFALFGSPGAAQGAELLADALREMLNDNRREKRPTRSRAYQPHVRIRELEFADTAAVAGWREAARAAARQALAAGDFLLWVGGNHLSVLPVYEELGALGDAAVVQLDAHLDLYNLSDSPPDLNHGNFLRHAAGPLPALVNVGHRDLFLPERSIKPYYRATFPASALAVDPAPAVAAVREFCQQAGWVFIDIDCDVLDPAYFPATAHPLPFGVAPPLLLRLIDAAWGENVCGVAVSEFDPGRDRGDQSLSALVWLLEYLLLKQYERA
ncbi:MAG TPA: arginase family protein [Gemmataceae bacterium]|jgi:arginase family enzyme